MSQRQASSPGHPQSHPPAQPHRGPQSAALSQHEILSQARLWPWLLTLHWVVLPGQGSNGSGQGTAVGRVTPRSSELWHEGPQSQASPYP